MIPLSPFSPTPQAVRVPAPNMASLPVLLSQLGTQTRIRPDGLVEFNNALIDRILPFREGAIPGLGQFLSGVQTVPALLEGLQVADRMAEAGVRNLDRLYPAVSRWNTSADPLVQIYLAGFYRKINTPVSFGPMLATLVQQAVNNYPAQASPSHNVTEEIGGTLLQQVAETTARETVRQLLPYLNPRQQ